jgi:hypothetical protein
MDPIKNFISATDPVHEDPSVPDGEAALRRMFAEPAAFTDSLPPNVPSLEDRQRRLARPARVLTLAAAAVTAGVLVATNLGALTTAPEPASTVAGLGTASSTATPTPTPTPTASVPPSASPALTATAPAVATGPVGCTKDNVVAVQSWLAEQLPSMQVSGCAGDWMALSITATGGQMDTGSWFWMAKLAGRKYIIDADQESAQVPGWDAVAGNNDRLTAEEYMDGQLTAKGIPHGLRTALVGNPAPGSLAARGIKTFMDRSTGYKVSFTYPAAWQLADPPESNALANGPGTSLTDSAGKEVARLALGDTNEWTGCRNEAPYQVIDSQLLPGLPADAGRPEQGTPRFAYVAMTSAVDDGGPVQAGIGITNRIAGQDGVACVLDFAVMGPGPLKFYSFSNRRPLGGSLWGLYNFQTMEEATAFTQTKGYKDLKAVITSLTVTKLD